MTDDMEKGLSFDLIQSGGEASSIGKLPLVKGVFERILNIHKLNNIYAAINDREDRFEFIDELLKVLNIRYSVSEGDLQRIPKNGPLIVISNHPFGGIDGIILSRILLSIRPDVKVMANYILKCIPEIAELFVPLDPFGKKGSLNANIRPLRETLNWLKGGGLICAFPAGEVSHVHIRKGKIMDPKWSPTIARIVRRIKTPVLPVYFHGHNSALFQIFGLVHPLLRTIMLPGEMTKRKDKNDILLKVGNPIPYDSLRHFTSDDDMIIFLRMRTYILRDRDQGSIGRKLINPVKLTAGKGRRIIRQQPSQILYREILSLGDDRTLAASNPLRVLVAHAKEIPKILDEIGRLREVTFRMVGEGTGKTLDRDRFDEHYLHVFLWNDESREVAGAYRMGLTDEIIKREGMGGLYTRTLFHYGTPFMAQIDPAIELGRSFVRPEYQKSYQPLMLLWRGIAGFVSKNPGYRRLFGPVSITRDYNAFSRNLMVAYLQRDNYRSDFCGLVRPRKPIKRRFGGGEVNRAVPYLQDLRALSDFISEIERDEKGIPILLKHYIRLGAKILGFNVDHKFSDVLDALIIVDLAQTDRQLLDRHMGKEEAAAFLEYHSARELARCA